MERGALLINTARGPVVESEALVEALNAGHLGGAGIDVFANEPIPAGHPLLACHQVVLMPHNADQTPEGMELLNAGVVENVIARSNRGHSRNPLRSDTPPSAAATPPRSIRDRITIRKDKLDAGRPLRRQT